MAWEVARALQGNNPYRDHLPRRNIHIALASTNMAQVIEILLPRIQAFFDGTDFTLIPESIQRRVWRCPQTNNRIKAFAFSQAVQAMRGYGLHMLVLDEVEPTDPTNIWEELYARLVKVDGDLLISATPENALWVRDKVENNVHLNLEVIRGSTVENMHNLPNPEAVQAWMDGMSEAQYKMYIEGEYGTFAGLIYSKYDPRVHDATVEELEAFLEKWGSRVRRFTTTDFTASDNTPGCTLWIAACREARRAYVYREDYSTGSDQDIHIARFLELSEGERFYRSVCDRRGGSTIRQWDKQLRSKGYYIQAVSGLGTNQIMDGIRRVQTLMGWHGEEGAVVREPMLKYVRERCPNLIREKERYIWNASGSGPDSSCSDHALDTERYIADELLRFLTAVRVEQRVEKQKSVFDFIREESTMKAKYHPREHL